MHWRRNVLAARHASIICSKQASIGIGMSVVWDSLMIWQTYGMGLMSCSASSTGASAAALLHMLLGPVQLHRYMQRALQIKRIFLYQLPPRGMWAWWCEGLSPLDLIVWLGTWALIVTWTWQLTQSYWEYIHGRGLRRLADWKLRLWLCVQLAGPAQLSAQEPKSRTTSSC